MRADPVGTPAVAVRSLHVRVLGPLEVLDAGGTAVALGGPRQRAVLAQLIVHVGQVVPVDTLVDAVWGDSPPATARSIVQTYVSHLRDALGAEAIEHRSPGYRLAVPARAIDERRFATLSRDASAALEADPAAALVLLDEALGLWRGPAYADLTDDAAIAPHAARLDAERLTAQERRIESMLRLGWASRAADAAEELVAGHPYQEHAWELLLTGLYRAGRQRDALDAFLRVRRLLDRELGVEPSPPLVELQRRILRHDPTLLGPGPQVRGYRVERTVGEGRLGVVMRAVDPRTGGDVLVETVRSDLLASAGFVRRFETAARAVARLDHPAIERIVDVWRDGTGAWVVTEASHGRRLQDILDGGTTPAPEAAMTIVEQVAAALDHAHRASVAHGHVSPATIELDEQGAATLGGFWLGDGPTPVARADLAALAALAMRLLPDLPPGSIPDAAGDAGAIGLAAVIRRAAGLSVTEPPVGVPDRNPYKGLRPFEETDRRDFFGRERMVRQVVERLREDGSAATLMAIVGPSGTGKTSLIAAGVIPAIRAGALWDAERTWVLSLTGSDRPREDLEGALRSTMVHPTAALRALRSGGRSGLLAALRAGLPQGSGCLVVIDRFEELFIDGPGAAERDWFLGCLSAAVTESDDRLRIIVVLRADRYDLPLRHPSLGPLLAARTEAVPPLSPDELEAAIAAPAGSVGVTLGPGLLATLVADAAHHAGARPFLEYVLTELFERRMDGVMTLEAYRAMGGLTGALSSSADGLLALLDARQRRFAREILLRMVAIDDTGYRARHAVRRSELERPGLPGGDIDGILDLFGRHRLIITDRDPETREPTVELAHEALITGWTTLRDWIAGAADDLGQERALVQAAVEWELAGFDGSFLLRGARLERIETWARGSDLTLGRLERAFIDASVQHRDAETARDQERAARTRQHEQRARTRLRGLVVALIVLLSVAMGAAAIAVDESDRNRANAALAQVRGLGSAAIASIDEDPEQGLLLAMRAFALARDSDIDIPPDAEQALHDTLAASRAVLTLPGIPGPVAWGAGRIVATGADGTGTLALREPVSGVVTDRVGMGAPITDVVFAPDGAALAIADAGGRVRVLDAVTLEELSEMTGRGPAQGVSWGTSTVAAAWPDEGVVRVLHAADGALVASLEIPDATDTSLAPDDASVAVVAGDVEIRDVMSGAPRGPRLTPLAPLSGVAYPVSEVSWSPDGRWIATASMSAADVWTAATGEHATLLEGHVGGVESVAWSSDSGLLVTGGADGTTRGWTVGPGDIRPAWTMRSRATRGGVTDLAVAPDRSRVLASGAAGATIWDLRRDVDPSVLVVDAVGFYGDVAFLPDGSGVVGAGRGGRLEVLDGRTGEVLRSLGPPLAEHWFDLAPDGSRIAIGGGGPVTVLDMTTGAVAFMVDRVDAEVSWSPDGTELAVGDSIVDASGSPMGDLALSGYQVREPRYSPDGTYIVTSGDTSDGPLVVVWDRSTRTPLRMIEADTMDVAFDPASRLLATQGGEARPPAIWDLVSGELVRTFADGAGPILDIAFDPAGQRLATAGADGSVRLFDVTTGTETLILRGHRAAVRTVVFDRSGGSLASQAPGEIRVWTIDPDQLLVRARSRLTRGLTDEECQRFLRSACQTPA